MSNDPNKLDKKVGLKKTKEKITTPSKSSVASIEQALGADEKFKTILGGRVIATLLGMFVLTIAAQSLWFSKNTTSATRSLSSTVERSLAGVEAYLSGSKRSVSSVATLPSMAEDFNFGVLHGRYTIKTKGPWITSLSSNGKFIKIGSTARFLKKHKKLWSLKFSSLKLSHVDKNFKVYTLLDSKKNILGKATINLDTQGNLQSLKFQTDL